jgi:death-on-curing protein
VATDYLTTADLLGLNVILIKRYAGLLGVRDPGALEAAIYRPQSGYYKDLIQEASALMESLVINHPFLDGNKRIAFAATDVFLRINGWQINCEPMAIYSEMMQLLEAGNFDFAHIEPWLRSICVHH